MAYPIRIPKATPIKGGLESVVSPVPLGVEQWRDGVDPDFGECFPWGGRWGCGGIATQYEGQIGNDKTSQLLTPTDASRFLPTMLWTYASCNVYGTDTLTGDRIQQVAEDAMDRIRWSMLADLLYNGAVGPQLINPSLQTEAATLGDQSDPAGIVNTVQGLLDAAQNNLRGDDILHVPTHLLPYFLNLRLVEWRDGNYWMGANLRVSFESYYNYGPDSSRADMSVSYDAENDILTVTSAAVSANDGFTSLYLGTGGGIIIPVVDADVSGNVITIEDFSGTYSPGPDLSEVSLSYAAASPVSFYPGGVSGDDVPLLAGGTFAYKSNLYQPADDEFWMYLTGPIYVGLDGVHVDKSLDARLNSADRRVEQGAILYFDPCNVLAAKAKVCL